MSDVICNISSQLPRQQSNAVQRAGVSLFLADSTKTAAWLVFDEWRVAGAKGPAHAGERWRDCKQEIRAMESDAKLDVEASRHWPVCRPMPSQLPKDDVAHQMLIMRGGRDRSIHGSNFQTAKRSYETGFQAQCKQS